MTQKSLFILGGLAENKLAKFLSVIYPKISQLRKARLWLIKSHTVIPGNALLVTSRNPKNRDKGIALFLSLGSDTIKNVSSSFHTMESTVTSSLPTEEC